MHFVFIPYGIKEFVDRLVVEMQCQKFLLKVYKEGEKEAKGEWVQGSVRILPFGVYEYVFPKEDLDVVLTSLKISPDGKPQEYADKFVLGVMRKALKLNPIPKFNNDKKFLWINEHVTCVPLGIRKDGEITEPEGNKYAGYTHEAL